MSTLVIDVDDSERKVHERFTFDASPVRIGRSQLNELPLPFDFVSHCHGIVSFQPGRCEYVDLGSTNGTFVGGERLPKNVPRPLQPETVLSIGKLQLTVRQTDAVLSSRRSYAFDVAGILAEVEAHAPAARPRQLPSHSVAPRRTPSIAATAAAGRRCTVRWPSTIGPLDTKRATPGSPARCATTPICRKRPSSAPWCPTRAWRAACRAAMWSA
jgi:hypothetical protein